MKSRCTVCNLPMVQPPVGRPRVRCGSPQCETQAKIDRHWQIKREFVEAWDVLWGLIEFDSGFTPHYDRLSPAKAHRRLDGDNDYPITPDLGPWAEEFLKDFPEPGAEVGTTRPMPGWLTLGDRAGLP